LASLTINGNVTSWGSYLFSSCSNIENVTVAIANDIPSDFMSSTNVKNVNLGHVTSLGYDAFENCYSVQTIILPDFYGSIGNYAFYNCYSLVKLIIDGEVTSMGTTSVFYGLSSLEELTVGKISSIPDDFMYNKNNLKKVYLGSVSSLGLYAFQQCTGLEEVTLPDFDGAIPYYCFYDCYNLKKFTIDGNITSIDSYAFYNCQELDMRTLTIPDTVKSIGTYAFYNLKKIEKLIIPASVKSISDGAFSGCESISVAYYRGVNDPGSRADDVFEGCMSLDKVYVNENYKSKLFCGMRAKKIVPIVSSASSIGVNVIVSALVLLALLLA